MKIISLCVIQIGEDKQVQKASMTEKIKSLWSYKANSKSAGVLSRRKEDLPKCADKSTMI
jgi:hypothetical protein